MAGDLEPRRRSGGTLSKLDDALLIGVGIVAVLVVLKIVGIIAGTIFFLVKAAIVIGVVVVAVRLFARGRRS
jgi:hypothetical protein